eukprot:SAG22_NODE_4722_length_1181_cov_4.177449_2_plen_170_part_00
MVVPPKGCPVLLVGLAPCLCPPHGLPIPPMVSLQLQLPSQYTHLSVTYSYVYAFMKPSGELSCPLERANSRSRASSPRKNAGARGQNHGAARGRMTWGAPAKGPGRQDSKARPGRAPRRRRRRPCTRSIRRACAEAARAPSGCTAVGCRDAGWPESCAALCMAAAGSPA